jgi:hypothetical protein
MIRNRLISAIIFFTIGGFTWYIVSRIHNTHIIQEHQLTDGWQLSFAPGKLSKSHSFLSSQCMTCHAPGRGVTSVGCVSCHANNEKLLKRQSSAFHANITSCKECHREHQGGLKPPLLMDHEALARIGIRSLKEQEYRMKTKLGHEVVLNHALDHAELSKLNCVACHSNQDVHKQQFGKDCISCHSTTTWRIAEYQHPSVNDRQCVQCHQAPPSHNMGHFAMVSKKIAGQEHAQVQQCFLCHRTTSWNDIQGVGWYKHH